MKLIMERLLRQRDGLMIYNKLDQVLGVCVCVCVCGASVVPWE